MDKKLVRLMVKNLNNETDKLLSLYSIENLLRIIYLCGSEQLKKNLWDSIDFEVTKEELNYINRAWGNFEEDAIFRSYNHVFYDSSKLTINNEFVTEEIELCTYETEIYMRNIMELVAKETNYMITDIPLSNDTEAMFTNILYLNSKWGSVVDAKECNPITFKGMDLSKEVESFKGKCCTLVQEQNYKAFSIDYNLSGLVLTVIIPTDMKEYLAEIKKDVEVLQDDLETIQLSYTSSATFYMPEFELKAITDLEDYFIDLGLTELFKTDNYAIFNEKNVQLDKLSQSVAIKVNKEGTEAAAVTSLYSKLCAPFSEIPKEIHVDKPFLFFISDDNERYFFSGVVNGTENMKVV